MKKLFGLALLLCLMLPLLASCGGGAFVTTLPEWMSGKDAARLMLAAERLRVEQLKESKNILI